MLDLFAEEVIELSEVAEHCGRDDLLFRTVQWSIVAHYALGQMAECDQAIERAAEIAERLGSPRFSWEIDAYRACRLVDRGDRAGAEALLHRAGATLRRLRPDLHMTVELARAARDRMDLRRRDRDGPQRSARPWRRPYR